MELLWYILLLCHINYEMKLVITLERGLLQGLLAE